MINRLKWLGVGLTLFGFVFVIGAGYAYLKVQEGQTSLTAFSAAQNVKLSYNDQGQLVDRNDPAQAQAIMDLLTKDWAYPVNMAEFNPNDPLVNTGSEYMYQMATVSFHVLHGHYDITLAEDYTAADGTVYTAGTPIPFDVDGRYYSEFDRSDPVQAAARGLAWTPTALALVGTLGTGASTASTLQMGIGLAGLFAGVGGTFILFGLGLVWATRPETVRVPALKPAPVPA
ncbi:MAG TPA: hypothetical protein VH741_05655 [Candidatus Limnocylindrales bacterium]|jgi:hypothetical protein